MARAMTELSVIILLMIILVDTIGTLFVHFFYQIQPQPAILQFSLRMVLI